MSYTPRLGEQFMLESAVSDFVCVCVKFTRHFDIGLRFYKQKKQPHDIE